MFVSSMDCFNYLLISTDVCVSSFDACILLCSFNYLLISTPTLIALIGAGLIGGGSFNYLLISTNPQTESLDKLPTQIAFQLSFDFHRSCAYCLRG